jgi:hypothetical protein
MDRAKLAGVLISTLATAVFFVLGGCWIADRGRRWETPLLDPARFAVVHDAEHARADSGWEMVPVNLHCPHCLASLRSHQSARRDRPAAPSLIVLVVDLDHRPSPASVAGLGAERVWWDRLGVWRGRWGHRLYGEVLRFDARGRYLGTSPPPASDPSAALETTRLPERR